MTEINWRKAAYKITDRFRFWMPAGVEFADFVTDLEKELRETFGPLLTEPAAPPKSVEELASKCHDIYQQEAKRQGCLHNPDSYDDLSESFKECDRALARHVLKLVNGAYEKVRKCVENLANFGFLESGDRETISKTIQSFTSVAAAAEIERMKSHARIEGLRQAGIIILSRQADWTWSHVLARIDKWIAEENAKAEPHG